ncbi:response regulator transcription factor [Pedobacter sp. PAMC26386]|nr:response regulator transcription factor [Pedobacter sp. PAMC26386]
MNTQIIPSQSIFIAESNLIICEALSEVFRNRNLKVSLFTTNGKEVLDLLRMTDSNIVILSSDIGQVDPVELLYIIKKERPDIKIIFITNSMEDAYSLQVSAIKVDGHIHKGFSITELYYCIQELINGRSYTTPSINSVSMKRNLTMGLHAESAKLLKNLSKREREILHAIGMSYTTPIIANMLYISEATVNNHRSNIMGKLHIKGRNQLLYFALTYRSLVNAVA